MLDINTRKAYFNYLGYTYDKKGILKLQSDYFFNKKDKDGIYGKNTDILLQNVYNVKTICKNFDLKKDKMYCRCGGKYCTGYPAVIDIYLLKNLQNLRSIENFSMIVESLLRCIKWNKKVGGASASRHILGKAIDISNKTKTNTLEKRKAIINKWINYYVTSRYGYSNGYGRTKSNISYPKYPSMGISIHLDVK